MLENFPPILGNHIGIVVGVEDPEFRARVQVYIPHIMKAMYKDYHENFNKQTSDIEINDLIKDFEPYIDRLRHTLPWAEAAQPIFGGGTCYHGSWKSSPFEGQRIVNTMDYPFNKNWPSEELGGEYDTPKQLKPRTYQEDDSYVYAKYLNETMEEGMMGDYPAGIPESEGNQICFQHHLVDHDTPTTMGTGVKASRGMISVPAFGSKVWVFFMGGDVQRPVYFAQVVETACVLPVAR